MATGDAFWKAVVVTVPGSTGAQTVTGLGGTPRAVIVYASNFSTEDSVVTTTGIGLSRGMAVEDYTSPGTMLNNAAFVSPAGDQSRITNGVVSSLTTAGNASAVDVGAIISSFDADGFTLNYGTVTSGRKLVCLCLMGPALNVGGYTGTGATLTPGWKAGASLLHGSWNGPDYTGDGEAGQYYGGGAYPTSSSINWQAAGLSASGYPAHLSQWLIGLHDLAPTTAVTVGGTFSGPFLSSGNVLAHPTGGGLTNFNMDFSAGNGGLVAFWDDEDSRTGSLTPAQDAGSTATVSGLPFRPGLVLFYSISDEPAGQSSGSPVRGAVGFSAATPEFQWAAITDPNDRGSFQSFSRGFADTVHNTDLHAGTVALTSDGFVLTTVEDSATVHDLVWHAFGHPFPGTIWLPQIYRRVTDIGSGGVGNIASPSVPPGDVLLEDGGRITLEDDSGFLTLE